MSCKLVVCDDSKNVRAFLRYILNARKDLDIVAEGSSGTEAVSLCRTLHPDLMLIDIQMSDKDDGIYAIKQIRREDMRVKIIVLTVYSDDEFVINAFKSGADNFILKELPPEDILKTIDDTIKGNVWFSPMVAKKLKMFMMKSDEILREREEKRIEAMKVLSLLTKTELEILLMIRDGYSRREISEEKVVSIGTVKTHVTNILKKLNYSKMGEAIKELGRIDFFDYLNDIGG